MRCERTNNHDENPPRETKTKNDPNEKEQDCCDSKHLDMHNELLKGINVKRMKHVKREGERKKV